MATIELKDLQPQYDDYLRARESWSQVSQPGLEAFASGDPERMAADEDAVKKARLACFYAANELAERLCGVMGNAPLNGKPKFAGLTREQQAHVDSALLGAEGRTQLADYLLRSVEVVIFRQQENDDAPAYAVAPKEAQDFWLGCWHTSELAAAGAVSLGLRVADN